MRKMKIIRIGFDFDGTLTKFPPIIGFLVSVFNSVQFPHFIFKPFFIFIEHLPVFPNLRRLRVLKRFGENYRFVIISGRKDGTRLIEQFLLDYNYYDLFYDIATPRKTSKFPEFKFKEILCKAMEVDWYFEDNRYTVFYLRKKGIKAIRV